MRRTHVITALALFAGLIVLFVWSGRDEPERSGGDGSGAQSPTRDREAKRRPRVPANDSDEEDSWAAELDGTLDDGDGRDGAPGDYVARICIGTRDRPIPVRSALLRWRRAGAGDRWSSGETDDAGRIVLGHGSGELAFELRVEDFMAESDEPVVSSHAGPSARDVFVIDSGRRLEMVRGRVISSAGAPVPHARLSLITPARTYALVSSDDGAFTVAVPENELDGARVEGVAIGYRRATADVASGGHTLELTLAPDHVNRHVAFRLLDARGEPLPGVRVLLIDDDVSTEYDVPASRMWEYETRAAFETHRGDQLWITDADGVLRAGGFRGGHAILQVAVGELVVDRRIETRAGVAGEPEDVRARPGRFVDVDVAAVVVPPGWDAYRPPSEVRCAVQGFHLPNVRVRPGTTTRLGPLPPRSATLSIEGRSVLASSRSLPSEGASTLQVELSPTRDVSLRVFDARAGDHPTGNATLSVGDHKWHFAIADGRAAVRDVPPLRSAEPGDVSMALRGRGGARSVTIVDERETSVEIELSR